MKVAIIGSGNLAFNLLPALLSQKVNVTGLWSRNTEKALILGSVNGVKAATTIEEALTDAEICLLAIKDDVVGEISSLLPVDLLTVHFSGVLPLDRIKTKRKGVMWPIQSFSSGQQFDFKEVPLLIDGSAEEAYLTLKALADLLSHKVLRVSYEERLKYHLAAVFVNNFSNHLAVLAKQWLEHEHLNFEVLKPLIAMTGEKLQVLSPELAQTGPAARNDIETMNLHRELLVRHEHLLKIYEMMSGSIGELR